MGSDMGRYQAYEGFKTFRLAGQYIKDFDLPYNLLRCVYNDRRLLCPDAC